MNDLNSSSSGGKFDDYSRAFMSGPRMAASIVYPDQSFGSKGRKGYSDKVLRSHLGPKTLKKYSAKFAKCIQTIPKIKGPCFVYSNFVSAGGINDFILALEAHGIHEYTKGRKTSNSTSYGVFRTGEYDANKKLISTFNDPSNIDGSKIKVIIGSPAMKEGISLKNTRAVHLLDPYWNISRTEQVIGRAIRFCSHVSLPSNQRNVTIYNYIGHAKKKTVDKHIMNIANIKHEIIKKFEKLLYQASVDCPLFHNANGLEAADCFTKGRQMQHEKTRATEFVFKLKNGKTDDNTLEKNLKNVLKAQGVNGRRALHYQPVGIKVNVKTMSNKFGFTKYPTLTKLISNMKFNKQNNETATVVIVPRKAVVGGQQKNELKKKLIFGEGKGKKRAARTTNMASKAPCPAWKQPIDGKCKNPKYPFRTIDPKTKEECCSMKPREKTGIQVAGSRVYINGKAVHSKKRNDIYKLAEKYGVPKDLKKSTLLEYIIHKFGTGAKVSS